jgi:ribosomal protein S18 acetylase RimI-like enzyme
MRSFWESQNNMILVARKKDTQAIVGYSIFSCYDSKDPRFGKKRIPCIYLLRIGVRMNSQRCGIGRKMMSWLFEHYPEHALSLDVNSESEQAVNFYRKNGLRIMKVYTTPEPDNVEFVTFETPLDKKGKKLDINDPEISDKGVQVYFSTIEEYQQFFSKQE